MRSRHLLWAGVGVVGGAGARRGPCATRDTTIVLRSNPTRRLRNSTICIPGRIT